ncbi:MAG: DinB family protein [Chloracidobacterium sp.]|nr:DinB family protein [Chloracidobacterium sp.]
MKTIRNETDRSSLIERVNKLTSDETPLWGKMNVNQMISHLVQGGITVRGEMPDKSTFTSRTFIKPLILYVLPMPKEVKVSGILISRLMAAKPLEFEADRGRLIDLMNKLSGLPVNSDCQYHPMFGKMSAKEWALIVHKHIDHHLKQFGV